MSEFYVDGQEVIDRVKFLSEKAAKETKKYPFCPVRILLLDFSMPSKNVLEVVTEL